MLPAVPPYSRRISGATKHTFRMCSWSGSRWLRKRSANTMIVSYAIEPVTRILSTLLFIGLEALAWIEASAISIRPQRARIEIDAQRFFAARRDPLGELPRGARRGHVIGGPQQTTRHRLSIVGKRELHHRILLRKARAVAQERVEHNDAFAFGILVHVRGYDVHQGEVLRQGHGAVEAPAHRFERRAQLRQQHGDFGTQAVGLRREARGRDQAEQRPKPAKAPLRLPLGQELGRRTWLERNLRRRLAARRVEQAELGRRLEREPLGALFHQRRHAVEGAAALAAAHGSEVRGKLIALHAKRRAACGAARNEIHFLDPPSSAQPSSLAASAMANQGS